MNPSTALARVMVDELVRAGVRDAVLAPGSRSAPLAFALHDADVAGRLRLHVRIDERSAAFVALGLAKASGVPVVVVTTSGTAAANVHPAVLEASEAGVPLLVLTADRPPELRATGANQTVDQLGLYGSAVRMFHEVGAAEERPGQNAYWRSLVHRALTSASGTLTRDPGPVHLNIAFREPLVPDLNDDLAWPEALDGRRSGVQWLTVRPVVPREPEPLSYDPVRTLVIVGDCPPAYARDALRLAEARGWPVLSEPSGNARKGSNALRYGHHLLADPTFKPARVLVVGRPTLWRSVQALLRDGDVAVEVVSPNARWADASRNARVVHALVPGAADHRPVDRTWLDAWRTADAEASHNAAGVLKGWNGPSVAATAYDVLPPGSLLVAGSSLPARDLAHAAPREGVTVLANRGASGIDGTVSTAIGAALAWQAGGGGPAYALLGDLTFLHDANGLLLGPDEPRPDLTILVVNNDGGGIFALLEQGAPEYSNVFERVFGTPTGADIESICRASGTPYVRVKDRAELLAAVTGGEGLRVIEARVPRSIS
jgi:2-succinyl-5-enolpyruvyl-6-hydroxy-3-cyclohexene-1-carboxylate synthase